MTFLRTLGFTISTTILFLLLLFNSFLDSPFIFFIICAAIGFLLYYLFRELPTDDILQRLSMMFITGSIVIIVVGSATNLIVEALQIAAQRGTEATSAQTGNLASIFGMRNIFLELIFLLIGLFAPTCLFKHFKENEAIPYKRIIWNVISVAIIYCIALLIISLIIYPSIFGRTAVMG